MSDGSGVGWAWRRLVEEGLAEHFDIFLDRGTYYLQSRTYLFVDGKTHSADSVIGLAKALLLMHKEKP